MNPKPNPKPNSSSNRRILIIHHVEPMWEGAFDKDELLGNIMAHLRHNKYDEIILTQLEETRHAEYAILNKTIDRIEEWSYGFKSPDYYRENPNGINPEDIIEVCSIHNYGYLYNWIKELKGRGEIYLCGGHRWECLSDLIDSLERLDINYSLIEDCIYG